MLIACSNCKSQYSLTGQEIQALPFSVFRCKRCEKNIKIAQCPECKSHYSITFTAAGKPAYTIKCVKCSHTFNTEFPVTNNVALYQTHQLRDNKYQNVGKSFQSDESEDVAPRRLFPKLGNIPENETRREVSEVKQRTQQDHSRFAKQPESDDSFSVRDLLTMGLSAFSLKKISVASIGVFSTMLLIILYSTIVGVFYRSENTYLSSLINLFPLALVLFSYTIIASVIARLSMEENSGSGTAGKAMSREFLMKVFAVSSSVNAVLMFLINLVLILFGELPIIGPVFFSLLFLPIYLISLMIVLLYSVGLWFFPAIIAGGNGGIVNAVNDFAMFIKKYNFSLIYTIVIMTIGTSLIFAAVYLFHYGALTLTLSLSNAVLSEEGMKVFSAVPTPFLRISDMSIVSVNVNLFQSLISGLIATHHVGGIILGVVFSLLTVLLISCFVSITSTVSTKVYITMERGIDFDDKKKVRLLVIFVLILMCLYLFKKVFF